MRLNKYNKAWIDKLMSGKTRKCKDQLADGKGRNCCLGVGINVCKLEQIQSPLKAINEDLTCFVKTMEVLKINSNGQINFNKLTTEWKRKLKAIRKKSKLRNNFYSLIELNDYSDMTHKEIGQFINENREAVFLG